MSKEKPSIPKGTRDFGPAVVVKRNYIFGVIRRTFEKFGYLPLETPAMEQLSVLTGKYGDEGDQLIFKILNSGDFLSKTNAADIEQGHKHLTRKISEKALRYDLTVPFARFVVMNRNEITFPFKRYQIQPVWRADRPQKGRYREFYQCDADVVGTDSLLCEAEIVQMINETLTTLGLTDFTIKINHRGVLAGIAEAIGEKGRESEICVAIDKLDKIGQEGVRKELLERGIAATAIDKLEPLYALSGSNENILEQLQTILGNTEEGQRGLQDLHQVWQYLKSLKSQALTAQNESGNPRLQLDVTLARGLSYYTGCIFEVKVNNVSMGSISGGGRYDNLTGMFGMPGVSGVGFSFGVDRIYDVLEELQLFPDSTQLGTQVLLVQFDKESELYALPLLQQLRDAGIASELYPEAAKLKKQMSYADQKNIPYVILIGSEEIATGKLKLRNMQTGEQQDSTLEEVIAKLNS
ncbi:histidine--tRNA ligase [Pontibacter harenae]|uniref:histidine--tRNA ligase n=1 Tax=Pontibacter harenae TaxID=2894083 RepID=UPI001E5B9F59|nr:histidine--tRNA ligase [Pontibacter harenae]MCC9166598.1 histidine--tRNA ligase [Pontibacter harenae]